MKRHPWNNLKGGGIEYGPTRLVFYPLYKFLRMWIGWGKLTTVMTIWTLSGLLHALPLLIAMRPLEALIIFIVFFSLGIARVIAEHHKMTKRSLKKAIALNQINSS